MMLIVAPIGDLYCIISFLDVKSRDRALRANVNWFVERSLGIFAWESFDLATRLMIWVHRLIVPLLLWNVPFFSFFGLELGKLIEIPSVTLVRESLFEAS